MLRKAPFFSYVVRMVTFFGFLGLSLYMNLYECPEYTD